jgi:diaminopimelate epimerase
MERRLILEFVKMNGAGNDFIVIDNRFYRFNQAEFAGLARKWCDRRRGIGADGILGLDEPENPAHDYRMLYFNADGSRGTMCGNGARCLARYARMAGIGQPDLTFESDAGEYRAIVPADPAADVRLFVPPPRHFQPDHLLSNLAFPPVHCIWTGTEHVVRFVEDVEAVPVDRWGPEMRRDASLAPTGANVNFVEVAAQGSDGVASLRVRTYEKGVETETPACGTGAIAAAVVSRLLGNVTAERVDVHMPGGTLGVGFTLEDGQVSGLYLEGPAEAVFRGSVEI